MTWDSALDLFLADLLKRGRKPSTVKQYRYDLSFCLLDSETAYFAPEDVFRSFDGNVLEHYLQTLKRNVELQYLM